MVASGAPISASSAARGRCRRRSRPRWGGHRALEVVQLLDRSPAAAGGVRPGDLILDLDGQPVEGVGDLQRLLDDGAVGRRIGIRVAREGRPMELGLTPIELAD